jgi:hypothetical protein
LYLSQWFKQANVAENKTNRSNELIGTKGTTETSYESKVVRRGITGSEDRMLKADILIDSVRNNT